MNKDILELLGFTEELNRISCGHCPICNNKIHTDEFRDLLSIKEFRISGLCLCSNEEMCKNHPNCFYKKVLKQLNTQRRRVRRIKRAIQKVEDEMIKTGANMCGELQNLYRAIDEIEYYCRECNLKFDSTAGIILQIINTTKDNK